MLDFSDVQRIIGIFRDESKNFINTIMQGCWEMLKERMIPLEHNVRTQHVAADTIIQLLIEKKVCTREELQAAMKENDYKLVVKEKEINEKIEAAEKIAKPTQKDKFNILGTN